MKPVVSKYLVGAFVGLCWSEYRVIEGKKGRVLECSHVASLHSWPWYRSFFFCFEFINPLRLVRAYS